MDKDPDPAKWCRSDRIRINNTASNLMYTLLSLQGWLQYLLRMGGVGGGWGGVVGVTIFKIVCWMFGNTGLFSPSDTCILSELLSFSIGLHTYRLDTRQESSFFSIKKGKQRSEILIFLGFWVFFWMLTYGRYHCHSHKNIINGL